MITTLKEKGILGYEWIDITSPDKAELNGVAVKYGLHTALVEDSLQPEHLPKYELVGEIGFVILRLYSAKASDEADTIQEVTDKIAVFLGSNFIITIHRKEYDFLHDIRSMHVDSGRCATPHQLLYRIISMSLGTYEPPLSVLIKELDFHEPKIFLQKKTPSLLKNLYYIKRRASVMNHIFDLSGSIVKNLKGKIESTEVNQLEDQLVKVQASARQIIDNVGNLLNVYISLSSQRTNEVVRVLTLFSVFFMPLTFIAGVYGMNFDIMPELRWTYGYLYSVLFMILVTVFIYVWFRRKGWL